MFCNLSDNKGTILSLASYNVEVHPGSLSHPFAPHLPHLSRINFFIIVVCKAPRIAERCGSNELQAAAAEEEDSDDEDDDDEVSH